MAVVFLVHWERWRSLLYSPALGQSVYKFLQ